MISTWVSAIVTLMTFVNGVKNEDGIQACAKVHTSSSVVPLGSPVTATCVIKEDCPLVTGQAFHIEWRLDDRLILSSSETNESSRVSKAVISSFNETRAILTCCIQTSPPQVVAGVEIRAGYPPEVPQNLSCQTNLTTPLTITCRWDPGQRETHLPTQYFIHTEIWDANKKRSYELPKGVHHYTIPRPEFVLYSDMKIYVKAVNELGETTSAPLILEPISSAKFDPPKIFQVMSERHRCLRLRWNLSPHQLWVGSNNMNLEIRLKSADSSQWNDPVFARNAKPSRPVDICGLLHWTQYFAQIRVRYQQSPWSEWSSSQSGVTLESAPTGSLDSWMKISGDHMPKQLNISLFWKPSKQFRANGQNVLYIVSVRKLPGEKGQVCSTRENYCTFQLSGRVKKVYVRAVNAAGISPPTEVWIYKPKAHPAVLDVTAVPYGNSSFLVQWESMVSLGLTDHVVEWRPLLKTDLSLIRFEIAQQNLSSIVITGSFEPYKPYGISVYPRFTDGIGLPKTVNAYLRQKAPSMVPKIHVQKTWKSRIELTWDQIPLDQRNGIIQNYTVFYWDQKGPINIVNVDPEERSVILKDLNVYDAFLMVRTLGGSLNGSIIHFEFEPFDAVAVVMIVIASGLGLSLLIIFIVLTCFSEQKRLKGFFWPAVPDPVNSSILRWASESTQYTHPSFDSEEPNPIYLSHLSFLDLPMKLSKEEDDLWIKSAEETSDLGESICGSPFITEYSGSNSDSVPYATVMFSGLCNSPPPKEPHVYLRSESTQPLLETEEPFTPKCYQNLVNDGMTGKQCFFGPSHDCAPKEETDPSGLWEDFPFLRALTMNDTQND
uniref:Colony stimulating factor 3 receptor n=1 Tax=Amphilophus citrinellus TaxID=61819 RepID=A0A3Q0SS80_AMPCI